MQESSRLFRKAKEAKQPVCKKALGFFTKPKKPNSRYARKLFAFLLVFLSPRYPAKTKMSWPLLILIACIGFALGAALRVLRSRNSDPFANLARDGQNVSGTVTEIEESGAWFNVAVNYVVAGTHFTRTLPWPSMNAKPVVGTSVEVRYLPTSPGLSRLA